MSEQQPPSFPDISERIVEAPERINPILLWAALAGSLTGLVGGVFQISVTKIVESRLTFLENLHKIPVGGALLSISLSAFMVYLGFVLMRRFAPDTGGSGIPQIEGYLDGLLPLNWRRVLPVKFLAGLSILGSGMVMGREGPTIQMGGAIGKMVGSWFRVSKEQSRVLVAASAGAGLTTAFNAPLAGILFVFEEMRPEFTNPSQANQCITIASIMAVIVLNLLMGNKLSLAVKDYDFPPLDSFWVFVLLGIFLGIIGYVFNILLVKSLNFFSRLQGLSYLLIGVYVGGLIGLISWLYPHLTGGGEDVIIWSLDNHETGPVLLLLFLGRFLLTMVCYGSGAPGGVFAPMLSLATVFSQALGRITYAGFPQFLPQPGILTVAGMGALVAATVRAPLTAITLTIEMTGNYQLIVPLLVTCLTSSVVAEALGGEPIYTVLLERMLGKNK